MIAEKIKTIQLLLEIFDWWCCAILLIIRALAIITYAEADKEGAWKLKEAKTTTNHAKGSKKENDREWQLALHKGKGVIIENWTTWTAWQ